MPSGSQKQHCGGNGSATTTFGRQEAQPVASRAANVLHLSTLLAQFRNEPIDVARHKCVPCRGRGCRDPLGWGDPEYRLDHLKLTMCRGIAEILLITYGVDLRRRIVHIKQIRLMPNIFE